MRDEDDFTMKGCLWGSVAVMVCLALLIFACSSLVRSCNSESAPSRSDNEGDSSSANSEMEKVSPNSESTRDVGLSEDDLKYTSVPISGYWKEEDLIVNDEVSWIGSTCVLGKQGDYLILITNRHCLGLDSLYLADDDGPPEVLEYSLALHFPGGETRKVENFGILEGDIDIAWLAVKSHGLRFVALGWPNAHFPLKAGLEVVVVGSPVELALEGTHTYGRISAIRSVADSSGKAVGYIQTDAAINHGNSGGPIFVKLKNRFLWAGVAVSRVDGADNLGMAISASTLLGRNPPKWFAASSEGATRALK